MILTCNSCGKKFVVPDEAISTSGRMVQCGSCGNKWKQFPIGKNQKKSIISDTQKVNLKPKQKAKKSPKTNIKKAREISLYSPEYLAKKHGIKITDSNNRKNVKKIKDEKISFGFYNSLILFVFIVISFSRILFFLQGYIISYFPFSEFYLNYFFESIRNIFEIWKDLVTY